MTADTRPERRLGFVTANQEKFPHSYPDSETVLDAFRAGFCPFCGKGPYTIVASHVSRIHGINRLELRDMYGLSTHDSICNPTFSAARSVISRQLVSDGIRPPSSANRGTSKRLTKSRRQAYQAAPHIVTVKQYRQLIVDRYRSGESVQDLATSEHLTAHEIRRILRWQGGITSPVRSRRIPRTPEESKAAYQLAQTKYRAKQKAAAS